MERDDRYKYIHPLVFWGRVKEFSEIFNYISKSNVAEDLGKEKSRFNELIQRPYELTFESVDELSKLWQLSLQQMASLIEPACFKSNKTIPEQKDKRYDIIVPMINENKIKEFKDILVYIPKSVIADNIGKKLNQFDPLLEQVERFPISDLFIIGKLCELKLAKMFNLVKTQYSKENKS